MSVVLVFAACSNKEEDIMYPSAWDDDKRFSLLSIEEVISLFPDSLLAGTCALSDEEVLQQVRIFSENDIRGRTYVPNRMNIVHNYKVACNQLPVSKILSSQDFVEFSIVELDFNNASGFAVVCRDSRYPEILAYVPTLNFQSYQSCTPMQMMVGRAQDIAVQYIERYNTALAKITDDTRKQALSKVCKELNVSEEEFDFERFRYNIFIRDYDSEDFIESRGSVQNPTGTVLSSVGPLCGTTRLIQGWPCNQFMETTTLEQFSSMQHNGHFPAGCVNVALATMCSYFRSTIYCSYLGRFIDWNNVIDAHFNPYSFFPAQYDENTAQAVEVGYLLKTISEQTKTVFNENGGGTNIANAVSFMKSIGIDMSTSTTTLNYNNVRSSLGNLWLVYCLGTVTNNAKSDGTGSGHAWVIDGMQVRRSQARYELQNYNCYANCKFGWIENDYSDENYDGLYFFDAKGAIDFNFADGNNLTANLSCIPNIRKAN